MPLQMCPVKSEIRFTGRRIPDSQVEQNVPTWEEQQMDKMILFIFLCGLSLSNGLVNLALGKTAYQISTYAPYKASKAVDGKLSQNVKHNTCAHTKSAVKPWWEVDLGDIYNILSIKLYNRMDCCASRLTDVELYIGYGRNTNDYVLRGSHPGAIGSTYTFYMTPTVHGRWVRINILGRNYLHLCEVQVYGSDNSKVPFEMVANQTGTGNILASISATSGMHCCALCKATAKCAGVNYHTGACDLLETTSAAPDLSGNNRFYKLH